MCRAPLTVNACTSAHVLVRAAQILGLTREIVLTAEEMAVLDGRAAPEGIVV